MAKTIALLGRAGEKFGFGHLMRLKLIYEELKIGFKPIFFLQEPLPENFPPGFKKAGNSEFFDLSGNFTNTPQKKIQGRQKFVEKIFSWDKNKKVLRKINSKIKEKFFDIILLDGRDHSEEFISILRLYCKRVILLDDHGSARLIADLSIDSLPYPKDKAIPVAKKLVCGFKYLVLPEKTSKVNQKKVFDLLFVLGKDDPFGIEVVLFQLLNKYFVRPNGLEDNWKIAMFVNQGKLAKTWLDFPNFHFFLYSSDFSDLQNIQSKARYLITYFGLTFFEGWLAGAIPVLISPGKYHRKLAEALKDEYPAIAYPGYLSGKYGRKNLEITISWCLKNCFNNKLPKLADIKPPFDGRGAKRIVREIKKL